MLKFHHLEVFSLQCQAALFSYDSILQNILICMFKVNLYSSASKDDDSYINWLIGTFCYCDITGIVIGSLASPSCYL